MKPIYNTLKVTKVNKYSWQLLEDWVTPYGTIPKGFVGNGGNIPRIFWWYTYPAGSLFEASVIHDYYYNSALHSKTYADNIFKLTAIHYGVSKLNAQIAYIAVSLFGNGEYK